MRKILFSLALIVALGTASLLNAADELTWLTSYPDALAAASAQHKPVLVDFTGSDWCIWCMKLDKEIFSNPEFISWANDHVILLKLDFPRQIAQSDEVKQANAELADKYQVEGFPTILVLDETGKEKGRTGYKHVSAADYIQQLETFIK